MVKSTGKKATKKKSTKASSKKGKVKKVSKASASAATKNAAKTTKRKAKATKKPIKIDRSKEEIFNRTVLVIVTVIALLVLIVGGVFYFSDSSTGASNVNSTSIEVSNHSISGSSSIKLLVVEDPDCKTCNVDLVASRLKETIMPGLEVEKVDYKSPEGKNIVKEFNLTQVPAYFFSSDITSLDNWESQLKLAFKRVTINGQTYYMLNPIYVSDKVMLKELPLLDNAIVMGDPNAPVTLYEFSDFGCPFCSIAAGDPKKVELFKQRLPGFVSPLPHVIEEYVNNGKVKIVFYNFPIHKYSEEAAEAGWCANEQGKFYEMYKKLFYNQDEWANENYSMYFRRYAKEIGLDLDEFNECLKSRRYKDQVEKEKELGINYGITGTPTFFVGRQMIQGAQNYSVFKEAIEDALS